MSITSLMIYGSCARGDNEPYSDVDILALHSESYYKMNAHNKLNIVYYSCELLQKRMQSGNLFCLHLVKEGKIIHDTNNILKNILEKFEYKESYEKEIKEASELCWTLMKFAEDFDNLFYFNKKLAWCVRTIIIAKSAEQKTPVFSKNDLSNFINDKSILSIIGAKDSDKFQRNNLNILEKFLALWGTKKPFWLDEIKSINEAQYYFDEESYAKHVSRTFKETGYSF
jgi:hypothetical protein